jgi:Dolichyl-phosphate-mannose-protein mannosyltransferase
MNEKSPVPPLVGYAMGAVAAFGLALAFAFVCTGYPIEWAEGRVFETARLILQGAPLYCDIQVLPCADLTYPPPYAALVAALAKVFGLGFGIGRAVSFASLLWVLVSLYRIARTRCGRWPALAAPALFLFFIEACYFAGLMRPDFLSLALVVCAIDVLLRKPSIGGAIASALLALLGLFVKPQAFAAVFAMTVYLAIVDRKRLRAFVAVGAAGGVSIVVLGEILTGRRFIAHHFWYLVSPGHTWAQLGTVLFYGVLPWTVFFAVAFYQSLRQGRSDFVSIYFFASLVWALVSSGSTGAAPNYLFELYVATSLAIAGFLGTLRERSSAATLLALQIFACAILNPWIGLERYLSLRKLWSARATIVPALRAAPEPILVEEPGVAGYTGHRLFVNSYVVTQLSNMKRWDQTPLLALLRTGRFSRVVLREAPADRPTRLQRERFTPEMLEAIAARYRIAWSDGNWFVYEPR